MSAKNNQSIVRNSLNALLKKKNIYSDLKFSFWIYHLPSSHPQLVYQRSWYAVSCLWDRTHINVSPLGMSVVFNHMSDAG